MEEKMMTRTEIHSIIDQLPESELMVLSSMLESMQITRLPVSALTPPAPGMPAMNAQRSPIKPPPALRPPGQAPLANQYNEVLRETKPNEHASLLRKVMFTRVSDLMSLVNKG